MTNEKKQRQLIQRGRPPSKTHQRTNSFLTREEEGEAQSQLPSVLTCLRPAGRWGAGPEATWPSQERSRRRRCAGRPWRWRRPGRKGSIRMNQPTPSPAASTGARLSACQWLTEAAIAGDRLPHLVPLLLRLSSSLPRGAGSRRIRQSGAGQRPPSSPSFGEGRGPGRCGVGRATRGRRWRRDEGTCDGHRQTEAGSGGAAGAALEREVRRRSRGRGGWRWSSLTMAGRRREREGERKRDSGLLVAAGDGGWRGVVGAASWTPAPSGGEWPSVESGNG
ncbi:uncharacterized protein [Triticum aestivum]|uniref:uncharacterized protein n=1 Tax=Triticum aestivum TaxID=4565 RepID=UPI001D007E91|nr:uncharacterized protein LOC123072443 [Triticum aestivum]